MKSNPRLNAILQALLVTLIWSSSWLIIKFFIHEIPPLSFAALRFGLAFLLLLPALYRHRSELRLVDKTLWGLIILLGVVYYFVTQAGQFLVLKVLDATTFSLMLNFTTPIVAVIGLLTLKESISGLQWLGMAVFLVGVVLYFQRTLHFSGGAEGLGLAIGVVFSNAAGSLLGRWINRNHVLAPITVTALSMGVGAGLLLPVAWAAEGLVQISGRAWLAILWLAGVNTAFAFWLWNKTLRVLTAMESSIINNTMLIQIALLSYLFLNERVTLMQGIGLLLALLGVVLVSLRETGQQVSEVV